MDRLRHCLGLRPLLLVAFVFIAASSSIAAGLPLSTSSRWIVDEQGSRVKLACVNWVAHLEGVVPEGLSKQPVDAISKRVGAMGFNCVRLTWPLYLATNDSLAAAVTVRQSLKGLGLIDSVSGLQANNPSLIDLPLIQAYQEVVKNLGENNIMVILDNHISKPGWCCSSSDGNGFFGDKYFDPDLWVKGLTKMATLFGGVAKVIGMSLRNELRGPKQNVNDWYKYMQRGAEAVHGANPDVLVILSGLSYDKDLSFLRDRSVRLSFEGKLVFEAHWYGFSDGQAWADGNPNQVCGRVVDNIMRMSGFLLKDYPVFMSEFGIDQRGTNVNDNRYFNCFLGLAAELDLDWALWTLVGSYYLREGVVGMNEYYGALNWNWCDARNSSFLQRISALQSPFQGPGISDSRMHKIIFHPATGLCVVRKLLVDPLTLGPCGSSEAWNYSPTNKGLTIKGTYFCLQAEGLGKPVQLGIICTDSNSRWDLVSDSKMHLSSKTRNGSTVCLDVDAATNTLVTNECKCLSWDKGCDPASQWFKLVDSTRRSSSAGNEDGYSILDARLSDVASAVI